MNVGGGASSAGTVTTSSIITNEHINRDGHLIYFCSPITSSSAFTLINMLRAAETDILEGVKKAKESIKDVNKYVTIACEPKAIVLSLTTAGGIISSAFAVVDVIRSLEVPVHTVITGYVASAGTLISLAGHRRFMHRNATALIHELRGANWGKFTELRDNYENLQKMMDNIVTYYTENTKLTREELTALMAHDKDWSPAECIANGVVDEVVQPKRTRGV